MRRTTMRKEFLIPYICQALDNKDHDASETSGSPCFDPTLEYFDFSYIE